MRPLRRSSAALLFAGLVALGAPPGLRPQELSGPDSLAVPRSMGLPRPFRFYGGLGAGLELAGDESQVLARAMMGGVREFMNPVPGLAGVAAETWIEARGAGPDAGARLMFASNAAGIQVGADYSLRLGRADLAFVVLQPVRRGGLLFPGAGLRFDWIPARSTFAASVSLPLFQRWPGGRTRPRRTGVAPVKVPGRTGARPSEDAARLDPALGSMLDSLRAAARRVSAMVVPYIPPGDPARTGPRAGRLRELLGNVPGGDGVPGQSAALATTRGYHALLDRTFALAAHEDPAERERAAAIADTVRSVLLEQVLLPFDRDLGRIRRSGVMRALCRQAQIDLVSRLAGFPGLSETAQARVLAVHGALLDLLQALVADAQTEWGDSRYAWLPLQLALRPEAHDTQSEIDGLIERITGIPFLGGHDIVYTTDERFEPALQRSIREARDYHVLWIHDFAGHNPDGGPDLVGHQVVRAYLAALTAAAAAFERTRKVPTYLIFLDQYYYRRSKSDRWLRVLRDPLNYQLRLSRRHRTLERSIEEVQDALRRAVSDSPAIQAEARRRGPAWASRIFAVQVNVTFPPDPSFRGPRGSGLVISGMTDDFMRDHRKVAFADLTERDPSRGIAILTGLGVGEHYGRFQWIDRTMVVRGPGAVVLKGEARTLLQSQGFIDAEIPAALRPEPYPPDRAARIADLDRRGWYARLAIAMNAPGYGPKRATAAKAALYTLLPPGCTIVAADPQWLSRFWAGMLIGSALRGCKVLVIGPGPDNAPFSTSFAQAVLQRDLFLRLMAARDTLRGELASGGGLLAIGLFRTGYGTNNVPAGVREVRDGLRRHPFLRRVFPFHQSVWDMFEQADSLLGALGEVAPPDTGTWYHPRFHVKTQFFGSAEAMDSALGRPEWRTFFMRRIGERLQEAPAGTDIRLDHLSVLRDYLSSRTADEREQQVVYLEVGSHNQDPRSFMLDGEELCLVAGDAGLVAAGDMLLLASVGVEWLDDPEELERFYPAQRDILTEAARAAEPIF